MTYTIAVSAVKNSSWCTEELSETCRFSFQNKFEKLVHIVGFIIRIHCHAILFGGPIEIRNWFGLEAFLKWQGIHCFRTASEDKRKSENSTSNYFFKILLYHDAYQKIMINSILIYTGWTQKPSLISSSYKIKTYWNIFINMELQIY